MVAAAAVPSCWPNRLPIVPNRPYNASAQQQPTWAVRRGSRTRSSLATGVGPAGRRNGRAPLRNPLDRPDHEPCSTRSSSAYRQLKREGWWSGSGARLAAQPSPKFRHHGSRRGALAQADDPGGQRRGGSNTARLCALPRRKAGRAVGRAISRPCRCSARHALGPPITARCCCRRCAA